MAAGFKQATVNSARVPSTQSNFPVYVDLSRLGITTLAEAESVRVYADSAKTTEWAREIVSATEMHVKVPSMTSTTSMYVDYDGVRADYAATDTYGRNAVWSAYTASWRLQNTTGSTGTYDLTNNGADLVSAKIGSGYDFGGTSQDDRLETSTDAPTTLNTWTASAWVKMDTLVNFAGVFSKLSTTRNGAGANQNFILIVHNDGTIGANPGGSWVFSSAASITTGVWYKLHWVRSGSQIAYYVNGTARGTSTYSNSNSSGFKFFIGSWVSTVNDYRLDGIIDEVTFIQSAQTANGITTEYNNQNDEADFWGTWSNVATAKRGAILSFF
jgi:hypothetical protein